MNISKALGWAKTPAGIVAVLAAGAVGGLGAVSYASQPTAPASVVMHQVSDTSTPTATDTATVAPVVVPTTEAPTPVNSTTTAAPVVASTSEAPVATKVPAPIVHQASPGTYQDGTPVVHSPSGDVVMKPPAVDPGAGNAPQGVFGDGPGATPAPTVQP